MTAHRSKYRRIRTLTGIAVLVVVLLVVAQSLWQQGQIDSAEQTASIKTSVALASGGDIPLDSFVHTAYVTNQLLVKYDKNSVDLSTGAGQLQAQTFVTGNGMSKVEYLPVSNIEVVTVGDGKTIPQKIAQIQSDPKVVYAQPNFRYYPTANEIPGNDTYKGLLWGFNNTGQTVGGNYPVHAAQSPFTNADIALPEAWGISTGDKYPVTVAVIDNGVGYGHSDLVNNMWDGSQCISETGAALGGCNHGYDYVDNDKTPLPVNSSHGTHIAGVIAATANNIGVIGVAPHAQIMAIRMDGSTAEVIKSIQFAQANGAKIINFSWAYYGIPFGSYYDHALYDAIHDFPGLFFTSAGNGNDTGAGLNHDDGHIGDTNFPAGFEIATPIGAGLANIVTVTATDQNDSLASFADYGHTSIDVGAPGTNMYSTVAEKTMVNETFDNEPTGTIPTGWSQTGSWNIFSDAMWADDSDPYHSNTDTTLTTYHYNLTGAQGAGISFETACDTEYASGTNTDYMALEVSNNGNNFDEIMRWDEASLDALSGDTNPAGRAYYDFEGIPVDPQYLKGTFWVRFHWITNGTDNNHDGCYIDSFKLSKYTDGSSNTYDYLDGTSIASPVAAGVAALVEGFNKTLTPSQVRTIILTTGDTLPSLVGKTVTGKRINAYNALMAANTTKLVYDTQTFNESSTNDGSITTQATVTLSGAKFASGLTAGLNVLFTNVPDGLDPKVELLSPTTALISFFGNAPQNSAADSITNLGISFTDDAFIGAKASDISGSALSSGRIIFIDVATNNGGGTPQSTKKGLPRIHEN